MTWSGKTLTVDEDQPLEILDMIPEAELIKFLDSPVVKIKKDPTSSIVRSNVVFYSPDQERDSDGRWGGGGGDNGSGKDVSGSSGAQMRPGVASDLVAQAREGGFTYSIADSSSPKTGYSVSPYPAATRVIETKDFTPEHLQQYATDHAELLAKPGHNLGGWREVDTAAGTDKVWLDVVNVSQNLDEAKATAVQYDQKAIYDLGSGTVIDTGGTGGQASGGNQTFDRQAYEGRARRAVQDPDRAPPIRWGRSAVTRAAFDGQGERPAQGLGTVTFYSPDQERDDHGRWGSGGSGDTASTDVPTIAKNRIAEATLAEPALTEKFTALAAAHVGHLDGLAFRVKTQASLEKKINGDVALGKYGGDPQLVADNLYDVNRYTSVLTEENYTSGVQASLDDLKAQGDSLTVKNFWKIPLEDNPYQGVNVQGETPEGTKYELQFHTATSLDVKENQLHALYKLIDTMPPAEYEQKTVDLAASIPVPPGIVESSIPVKGKW